MSRHWYRVTARNFECEHPRQPLHLADAVAAFTGLTVENARHVLDRLHHLRHCLETPEPESITLLRLQAGKNQPVRDRLEPRD